MKQKLLNKIFVLGILILFIGTSPLSTCFSTDVFSNSKEGYDLELVEIVPMYLLQHHTNWQYLVFSCTIKNVGTEPTGRIYGFDATVIVYNWITNRTITHGGCHSIAPVGGELKPGEERAYNDGLSVDRFFPTFIRLKFSVYPYDSNTENNDAEAIYLVWGCFLIRPTRYMKIRDI